MLAVNCVWRQHNMTNIFIVSHISQIILTYQQNWRKKGKCVPDLRGYHAISSLSLTRKYMLVAKPEYVLLFAKSFLLLKYGTKVQIIVQWFKIMLMSVITLVPFCFVCSLLTTKIALIKSTFLFCLTDFHYKMLI